ncbi:GbsR/MarR family transcriptional regulator [Streptomyces sp. NPDC088116]|uniref:GbsR/MarR family transcriptional regulator n=1 Tax=Streptomyces sp. NPDC088116 TaxID=3365825 RepID=UPI0038015608
MSSQNSASGPGGPGGPDQGDRRPRADTEAVARFVERFASEMTGAGMQRAAARVFAALLASDDASLTSAELSEQLSISPAAVSGAIRYLTTVGMVSRERDPGSRRDRYRLRNELWYATLAQRDSLLTRWEDALREGVDSLGRDSPAGARVAETLAFFEFMQEELGDLLERWKEHRAGLLLEGGRAEGGRS